MKKAIIATVSGGAAALLAAGVTWASIPNSGAVYNGCVNKTTGLLRVVDTSKSGSLGTCITTAGLLQEQAITWNQVGPAGPAGPQGLAGSNGTDGQPGAPGADGHDGPAGAQGPQGPEGPEGPAGSAGPQGPAGQDGAAGPQGPPGAVSMTRVQGDAQRISANHTGTATASCPSGQMVVAGGFGFTGPAVPLDVISSAPSSLTTWEVIVRNNGQPDIFNPNHNEIFETVYITCA